MFRTFADFKRFASQNSNAHTLSTEEIKQIQGILLDMLDDFDALCRKKGFSYFLTGGSALGAFRENGFIPWDDDIDILMPRRDYDRLAQAVAQEMEERYWVQNMDTSPTYDLSFTKLRKKGTKYIEIFETDSENVGIFLDIFPLDDTYDNFILRLLNGIIDETLFFFASCVRIRQKKKKLLCYVSDSKLQRVILLKSMIGSLFDSKQDPRKWYRRCDRWQSKCRNPVSKYVTVSCGRSHYFGEMYRRDKILPLREGNFEGKKVFLPQDCLYFLEKLYGKEFMTPPPPELRERHTVIEWASDINEKQIDRADFTQYGKENRQPQ